MPLTDVAPGKTPVIDISPTNDPKYFFEYLKTFPESCTYWKKIITNAASLNIFKQQHPKVGSI